MKKIISPLRYPGGKSKVLSFMKELIEENYSVKKPVYVEPYAGGAGVALGLLINGYVSKIYINDIDPAIHAFWWSVKNKPMALINKIRKAEITIKEWRKQKSIYKNADTRNMFALGFATFFLNRCNMSGVLEGGVIGGLKQNGKYKMTARFNKEDLIKRIKLISKHRKNIILYKKDTYKLLKSKKDIFKSCLLYLDPPYYEKGHQLYKNHYAHDDHQKLSELMRTLKGNWVVSYDNVTEIKQLYKGFKRKEFNLTYFAGKIKRGKEIMFFSPKLKFIPNVVLN